MSLFRAVAWDIDGTLIDSEPLHQRALVAASAALGDDLSDIEPEAFRGVHAVDIWKALKPRFSAGAAFDTWIAGIERYYVAHAGELEPIPGALEAMRELQARGVGASLRVEFRAHDRRRQHQGARSRQDHRVLDEP